MKLFINKFVSFILLFSVVISTFLLSCNNNTPDFFTVWSTDLKSYRTNELSVAQQETPFTIVLPKYTPNDLLPFPVLQGTVKSEFKDNRPIRIMYYRSGEDFNPILIEEYNIFITRQPSDGFSYISISDVEVLEESTTMAKDITNFVPSYNYSWNYHNTHYNVMIAEYQREECRKVIESMINVMNK